MPPSLPHCRQTAGKSCGPISLSGSPMQTAGSSTRILSQDPFPAPVGPQRCPAQRAHAGQQCRTAQRAALLPMPRQIGAAKGWTMGGKTGSIDLPEHTGRCDWFAGFGQTGQTSVAVACILVHGAQRTMRSSFVGAEMIRACLDPAGVATPPQVQAKKKPAPAQNKEPGQGNPNRLIQKKDKGQNPCAAGSKTGEQKAKPPNAEHRRIKKACALLHRLMRLSFLKPLSGNQLSAACYDTHPVA